MKILIYRLMFSFGNWETKFMNILQTVNMFLTFQRLYRSLDPPIYLLHWNLFVMTLLIVLVLARSKVKSRVLVAVLVALQATL